MPNTVAQCRKYPIRYLYTLRRTIPYLYTWSRTIPYLYTLNRTIPYLYTLNRTIPYLNTLSLTIPYRNTLSRIIPYVNTLSRTIPYLNTLTRTFPYLNTLSRTIHYLNTLRKNPNLAQNQILVGSQSESRTLKPRQPIRIEYHSAEKNPNAPGQCDRPFSALGSSRLAIAYLNTWRVYHPPPVWSAHTLTTLIYASFFSHCHVKFPNTEIHSFFGYCHVTFPKLSGKVIDDVQRAIYFNHRNKWVDRKPRIAKKRLLRKKYKKHLFSTFQKI